MSDMQRKKDEDKECMEKTDDKYPSNGKSDIWVTEAYASSP